VSPASENILLMMGVSICLNTLNDAAIPVHACGMLLSRAAALDLTKFPTVDGFAIERAREHRAADGGLHIVSADEMPLVDRHRSLTM